MEWKEIIAFWFEETTTEQWFKKDVEFDKKLKKRFSEVYEQVMCGETEAWRSEPEGRLAEIIVLDQFSRNIFRDQAEAFQYDSLALSLAQDAIEVGADKELDPIKRRFLYMPFMHSESKETHKTALKLFIDLGNEEVLKYEKSHKKIIDQFGRYPHRNVVLGRESTHVEKEFLKENQSF